MARLSTWVAVVFFSAFSVFSASVKRDVAQREAFDSFQGAVSYGSRPPEFSLVDLDGTTYDLEDQVEDGKLILVNFWATWCPPCRLELPQFEKLHERYQDSGPRILAIDVGEDEATVGAFLEERPLSFPVLLDPDRTVAARYRIEAFPTTIMLDSEGQVIDVTEGLDPYLAYRIEMLLEAQEEE